MDVSRTITTTVLDEAPGCPYKVDDRVKVTFPDGSYARGRVIFRPWKGYVQRGGQYVPIVLVPVHYDGTGTAPRRVLDHLCCAVRDVPEEMVSPLVQPGPDPA